MTMNTYTSESFSLMQAAKLLGMNKNRACRWAKKGWIKTTRLPTGWHVVTLDEINRVKELLSGGQDNPQTIKD